MAHSSKNKSGRNSNKSTGTSSRPAFISGLCIGALIMYVLPPMLDTDKKIDTAAVTDIVGKADIQELKFDFYELLKDDEIMVSPESSEIEQNSQYVLQVGSFKSAQDAENLKVQLLLMNLSAESESVKGKSGVVWHRVLVGPFANTSKMASARAKLAQNEIDSLLLKRSL